MGLIVLGAAGTLQLNEIADGTEQTAIIAGLDELGSLRAVSVDATGRVATRDTTDVLGAPASHARAALDASGQYVLAANTIRTYIEVQNCLTSDIVMKLSAIAPVTMSDGVLLSRGMSWDGFYNGPISFYNGGAAVANAISIAYWTT